MASTKSSGPKGVYPNCADHLQRAGLTNAEAAQIANISTSSITRLKKAQPVLLTTCAKLINALNVKHFDGKTAPKLDFGQEVKKIDDAMAA